MKRLIRCAAVAAWFAGLSVPYAIADTTAITAGLNAPTIDAATGGSVVHWGPIISQTSLISKGSTNTLYPEKYAGTFISGSGGSAGSFTACVNPGSPVSGPGPAAPYAWYCNWPVPPAPQVNFDDYRLLAQMQGNSCNNGPCYVSSLNASVSGVDNVCTVNGHPKVWFFEGDVSISGGTYFCGVLLSRGSVKFTGNGAGDISAPVPAEAWRQYQVATPNGTGPDGAAADQYPGDAGYHVVSNTPYRFAAGGGGFNGSMVTFKGYIFATTGYTGGGGTVVLGAVQFGQGAASTSGGGTIFFQPQIIFSPPPPGTVNAPIITPPGGTFGGPVQVSIVDTTPGAAIYYTTDGNDPTMGSTRIASGDSFVLPLSETNSPITVKARAFDPAGTLLPSAVTTAVFTFQSLPEPAQIQFSASNYGVSEAAGQAAITVTRTGDTSGTSSVRYATSDGTARAGSDYTSVSGTLTFSPGEHTKTFNVPVANDGATEPPETVHLALSLPTNAILGASQATLTITDPAPTPMGRLQFEPAAYAVDESSGMATITVTRTVDISGAASVQFASEDGTATAGSDYRAVSGRLTFAPGETSKSFDVPILNDRLPEGSETVTLRLSNVSGATLGVSQAVLTILDQTPPPPPPPAPFISELVPYSAPVDQVQSLTVRVLGTGFDAAGAQVIWSPGPGEISLPIVAGSRRATEIDVTVNPAIWNGVAGPYPVIVRNPGPVDSNQAIFTVRPAGSNPQPPFVVQEPLADPNPTYVGTTRLTVLGGTFSPGGESVLSYRWEPVGAQPGTYSFTANDSNAAKSVTATLNALGVYRFRVLITDTVTGLTAQTGTLDITVSAPRLQFDPAAYGVGEGDGKATLTVTRTIHTGGRSTVQYATTGGTASAGPDYVAVSGVLTFEPGEASKTLEIPILNDRAPEGSETIIVTLSQPTGATLGTSQAVVTITDENPPPPPPPAPFISALVPYSAPVNFSGPFTMRVVGSDFDAAEAQVIWNNATNLTVLSRSATEIEVRVNPSVWNNTAGAYPVLVRNPGNVDSNPAVFTVWNPGTGSYPPPFVARPPQADPNPTYTTTTRLTVLGGTMSPGGESALSYQWQALDAGPAFSANGSNAAKNTVATFSAPGVYRFQVTITDTHTGHAVKTDILAVTVVSKAASLTLAPKTQSITADQTLNLRATVKDQFGRVMDLELDWTASAGSLAPSRTSAVLSVDTQVRTVHITAATKPADGSLSDFADVTVLYGSGGVADLRQAVLGPVPYRSDSGLPGVFFKKLNPGTTIRIFSTDGRLVATLTSPDGSDVLWELRNSSGSRVSSGVYFFIMEGSGQKREGKLVLIL